MMIELNYVLIPKIIIAILLLFSGFLVFGWLMQFLTASSFSELFNISHPIGVFGIILMLVFSGIYLLKIAFNSIKELIK
jgi:uncharacterized membrane protein (DUF485 family)